MTATMQMGKPDLAFISKHSNWITLWGVVLAIVGAMAISAASMTTIVTLFVLGTILTFAGAVILIDALTFWWRRWNGFFLHLLVALLYIFAGVMLMEHPLISSISITLILGIAYVCIGILRTFYAMNRVSLRWGWTLFNGLLTFLIGVLILQSWPVSSLFIIGLFVGIDLVFVGFSYIVIALTAQRRTA